jgi:hypothetical protein
MKAFAKMKKKARNRKERKRVGNQMREPRLDEQVLVRDKQTSDAAIGVTAKFVHPYEGRYIISKVIPPSTYELSNAKRKVRGEFNKKALKLYLEKESPCAGEKV